jgi:molybdate/tungstate transport system substrate-binding protein
MAAKAKPMLIGTKKLISLLVGLLIVVALASVLTSCGSQGKVQLKIYNAASLIVPFQACEKEFELKHPDIDVMLEGHGSVQVIRSITELNKEVDLAAVADGQLIPLLMYQTRMPDNRGPYADWYIKFATNRLGIAYTASSLYSSEITADTWYTIMSRPDVRIGLADPGIDSLGYRALMAIQLSEDYYQDDTIFEKLIINNFNAGFDVLEDNGITTLTVPQLVKPNQKRVFLRSYSIQLLALLESGEVDYAFEYESVARQRGLKFLELPAAIDLSSPDYNDRYKKVRVELGFQRFASVMPEFDGAPIIYGITIPGNAPHQKEAITFLKFLLGTDGQRIFAENYQPPLLPPQADDINKVPAELRSLLR